MSQKEPKKSPDMFKHENDSVDLLLKELHHEGLAKMPLNNDESLASGSPIKPLNYHAQKQLELSDNGHDLLGSKNIQQKHQDQTKRDFNSSSDTYVSDRNDDGENLAHGTNTNGDTVSPSADQIQPVYEFPISPSKSIMKSSASASPKKSVAFKPAPDTLHTYTPRDQDSATPTEPVTPLNHLWREVDLSNTSQDYSSPPAPPPHTTSTITGLLSLSREVPSEENDDYDVDSSKIATFKKAEKRHSNMSLNEKLNVFLTSSSQTNHDDLDSHLDQLGKASQEETDVNIHRLSYHMEEYKPSPESPFNALSKSLELYINSAHSSQSSLQSLMDSNRHLPADTVEKKSRGIQFNDGIKGFPDTLANLIIPITADEDSFSGSSSVGSHFSFLVIHTEQKQEPDRSYDQSYNLTEKSILNLLNSASQVDLPGKTKSKQVMEAQVSPNLKREDSFEFQLHNQAENMQPEQSPRVKMETLEPRVKAEPEGNGGSFSRPSGSGHENRDPPIKTEESQGEINVKLESEEELNSTQQPEEVTNIKKELDNTTANLLHSPIVKREETDAPRQATSTAASPNEAENGGTSEKEVTRKRLSKLSDFENDSDDDFHLEGHDPSTDVHTFRVDGLAVVPGPVKLVHSSDQSLNSLQHSLTIDQPKITSNDQLVSDESTANSSRDQSTDTGIMKLHTEHHQPSQYSSSNDSVDLDNFKDSVDYSLKSLAPPRSPIKKKDHPITSKSTEDDTRLITRHVPSNTEDFDSSVLANSSNVNPPLDIKLPVVETDENGFADLTKKINGSSSSFEESLSAENDVEKKPVDFISIWHSQLLGRRPEKPKTSFYKVPSILKYNTADLSQHEKYHIPSSLQPKKFTDVNLVSTRVVSLTYEDLNVSAFLPELSQDSGLESHFRSLVRNSSTLDGDRSMGNRKISQSLRRKSFDSLNVLSELSRSGTSETLAQQLSGRRRKSIHDTLKPAMHTTPQSVNPANSFTKKSRFQVPSFEIKRSNSILSPKNQYNDIFGDGSFVEPTIKALGMKTLPSMDRDDVKRIMQMKQAMSLEEYSGLKNVGALMVSATQQEPKDKYEGLQQQASIYSDSLLSSSAGVANNFRVEHEGAKEGLLKSPEISERQFNSSQKTKNSVQNSHVYDLLSQKPVAIGALEEPGKSAGKYSVETRPRDSQESELPDPDLNLITMRVNSQDEENEGKKLFEERPMIEPRKLSTRNPFRDMNQLFQENSNAPTGEVRGNDVTLTKEQRNKLSQKSWNEVTPEEVIVAAPDYKEKKSARNSPIKINSPVKVMRKNGSVTGIVLDKKLGDPTELQELHNKKIRNDKTHLSTVSVPSNIMSEWSNDIRLQSDVVAEKLETPLKEKDSPKVDKSQEKGKLFFRVVGLKNVCASEINNRDVAFNVTLDNGIHCIKTPNYQLDAKKVAIDKEFELSVSDSLEFILTLKATYTKSKPGYKEVKERKVLKSKHKIGRLFGSKEIVTTTKFVPQEVEDPLDRVFATDGSFARCYVDLDLYKSQITGQACNYNLTCFNEWATYTHNGQKVVKKPYHIAQLEVKMLYVPRSEEYEILPTSIKSAYESLDDLKSERSLSLEGYLHQEGGDCEVWKRRWFKLQGTSLIAHSEFSHKTRAKINLAKVVEVIFVDKENIGQSSTNYRNFSDIMLMENSFKIRFANGEIIDFGAPSKTEKTLWIKTIQEIVYRNKFRRQPWVKLMQEKNGNKRRLWIEA